MFICKYSWRSTSSGSASVDVLQQELNIREKYLQKVRKTKHEPAVLGNYLHCV